MKTIFLREKSEKNGKKWFHARVSFSRKKKTLSPAPAQPKIDTENSSLKSQPKKYPQKNRYLKSLLQNPKISKSAINR